MSSMSLCHRAHQEKTSPFRGNLLRAGHGVFSIRCELQPRQFPNHSAKRANGLRKDLMPSAVRRAIC